ncbi:MAG: hypothetical protein KA802_09245 [Saprospiraceae bacterium]|nr:hypothetical protein [Saprospiraceae bacterium]
MGNRAILYPVDHPGCSNKTYATTSIVKKYNKRTGEIETENTIFRPQRNTIEMTEVKKISVTRALAELKILDSRINTAITSGLFVAVTVGNAEKPHQRSEKDVTTLNSTIKSSFDSVNALIARRQALKSAVLQSNATTKVKINGTELTVAEAIDMKAIIEFKRDFLLRIKGQVVQATTAVQLLEAKMQDSIEKASIAVNGADKTKVDPAAYENVAGPIRRSHQPQVHSIHPIEEYSRTLEKEIEDFVIEVDFALSEVNSTTLIAI